MILQVHDRAQCFRCLAAAELFPNMPPCHLTFVPPAKPPPAIVFGPEYIDRGRHPERPWA